MLGRWIRYMLEVRKRTERSDLVFRVGGGRLGVAEHPREHFALRVANDR